MQKNKLLNDFKMFKLKMENKQKKIIKKQLKEFKNKMKK